MFHESLLEFEHSLAACARSNELMLVNLDHKAEANRFCNGAPKSHTVEDERLNELEQRFWLAFLNDPYKTTVALPNYAKFVLLQCGIPHFLRGVAWNKLFVVNHNNCSLPEIAHLVYRNFQHLWNPDIAKQIKKDLPRTFPGDELFQRPETVKLLMTILNVYASFDLDLGYCQGLLFLVGTLYHQCRCEEQTFHALCQVTDLETELRDIFVASSMGTTLDKWHGEFGAILASIDPELAAHLARFNCKLFLFQWWLSFALIHNPDMEVNYRICDLCLLEGWKVGIFKVLAGLLVCNKPLLMSFDVGDEEVIYQHLLNVSKWGNIALATTAFFGDLLLLWDDSLFLGTANAQPTLLDSKTKPDRSSRERSGSYNSRYGRVNRSIVSLFSRDTESVSSNSSEHSFELSKQLPDELVLENQMLRYMLTKAMDQVSEPLKREIEEALDR